MPTKNINIGISEEILSKSDAVVASGQYSNRSRLIEESIMVNSTPPVRARDLINVSLG